VSASIELVRLRKTFGDTIAINDLSLTVAAGEFFTLLGSSGSGKTTTLMMIAGFIAPDSGEIKIGGRSIVNLPPERRDVGVVFQSYALFPNMTVAQNVAFPLRMRNVERAARAHKVQKMLDLVNLRHHANRNISGLSGGEQQRVALARALVFEPPLLLMDEPLGALDRKLREQLQVEIKRIQSKLGRDGHLRYPRPGRSAGVVGSNRGDGRRRDPAGGPDRRNVRASAEPLCGAVSR
jgi:ABC-type Fe3+/spermidine/putrescine transport system ATPase subunit